MEQIVKFGNNSFEYLAQFLNTQPCKNILLLTGKDSYVKSGAHDLIMHILADYNYYQYSDFKKNPEFNDVKKAILFNNEKECDFIIG